MNIKAIAIGTVATVGIVVALGAVQVAGIEWTGFLRAKVEENRREVFEQSHSFVAGKKKDLWDAMREHAAADPAGKHVIEMAIESQFADFDTSKLEPEQQNFLRKIRGY